MRGEVDSIKLGERRKLGEHRKLGELGVRRKLKPVSPFPPLPPFPYFYPMQLYIILLTLHIAGGSLGLISGTVIMVRKKGDKLHRRLGKVFFYSMLTSSLAALPLAWFKPMIFLFMVGVFTFYMVASGQRYLRFKDKNATFNYIDWSLVGLITAFGLALTFFGIRSLIEQSLFGAVMLAFGLISLNFARGDLKFYRGADQPKNQWLLSHLQRMCGAYIASLTAFLVVNYDMLPFDLSPIVYWLGPSAVITPLIVKWSRQWAR